MLKPRKLNHLYFMKNMFDRKIPHTKAFMLFSVIDIHTHKLTSVCDKISN
jgi:hypothetical protein